MYVYVNINIYVYMYMYRGPSPLPSCRTAPCASITPDTVASVHPASFIT